MQPVSIRLAKMSPLQSPPRRWVLSPSAGWLPWRGPRAGTLPPPRRQAAGRPAIARRTESEVALRSKPSRRRKACGKREVGAAHSWFPGKEAGRGGRDGAMAGFPFSLLAQVAAQEECRACRRAEPDMLESSRWGIECASWSFPAATHRPLAPSGRYPLFPLFPSASTVSSRQARQRKSLRRFE